MTAYVSGAAFNNSISQLCTLGQRRRRPRDWRIPAGEIVVVPRPKMHGAVGLGPQRPVPVEQACQGQTGRFDAQASQPIRVRRTL